MAYRELDLKFGTFSYDDNYFIGCLTFGSDVLVKHSIPVNGVVLMFDRDDELVGVEFPSKGVLPDALKELVENQKGEIVSMSRMEEESYGKNFD